MNTHASIAARLSAATLADIEGLNPETAGFCRPECCSGSGDGGALPIEMLNSIPNLDLHLMIGTAVPAVKWDKLATKLNGYGAIQTKLKLDKATKVTLYNANSSAVGSAASVAGGGADDEASPMPMIAFRTIAAEGGMSITEFTGVPEGELPFEAKGAISTDRGEERYVFVCSHRERDERCGYCGPVLVDLMRKALVAKAAAAANQQAPAPPPVHVFPCSHIGGHAYAGNVVVYSKHGGRCFGRITPAHVDDLVDYVAVHKDAKVPVALRPHLRGTIGPALPPPDEEEESRQVAEKA